MHYFQCAFFCKKITKRTHKVKKIARKFALNEKKWKKKYYKYVAFAWVIKHRCIAFKMVLVFLKVTLKAVSGLFLFICFCFFVWVSLDYCLFVVCLFVLLGCLLFVVVVAFSPHKCWAAILSFSILPNSKLTMLFCKIGGRAGAGLLWG